MSGRTFLSALALFVQKFAQGAEVFGRHVADHEILQAAAPPAFQMEGPRIHPLRTRETQGQGSCLKNEHRDLVLADSKKQLRAGRLLQVTDFSSNQLKLRPPYLGQIEAEGNLSSEPGL